MNKIKLLILFALITIPAVAYTPRNLLQNSTSISKLQEVIITDQQWVPYPAYDNREAWNELLSERRAYFIEQGKKKLDYEWRIVPATAYLEFERSGNRQIMERPFGQNNQALVDLFMAELAEGEGKFIDQLINGVYQACEMTSWALSAHLSGPQISKRSLPDNQKHIIDLTSGDLSSILSWIYYYFHDEFDKINPTISERLRNELQTRTLDTYMNDDSFWWMAFDYQPGMMVNNWNPWCNFNVLQNFLLLETDKEQLTKAVWRTMESVDKFINYTHSDGACEEGPSYWGHAAGKMYDYLQMLYDATGGKISLFDHPLIKNMGEYIVNSYVGNGWVVNFADASARGGGDGSLIYRYGKAVKSEQMMHFASYLNSKSEENISSSGRDVFRLLQTILSYEDMKKIQPEIKIKPYSWYPETEFCYMTNQSGFFVAAKGGYNNESHNHNDIGTFSLYLDTVPVFIDAGVGTYTRQTFSSERYTIWTMQSEYHNVPVINGVSQAFGAEFKASQTGFSPKKMQFSTNIATAYPKEAAVNRWIRSYTLGKKELIIEDQFNLNNSVEPHQINFLTRGKVDCNKPGEVIIEIENIKAKLIYDKNIFTTSVETVTLNDPRLSNVWGNEIYRLSLNAINKSTSGKYKYKIQKIIY